MPNAHNFNPSKLIKYHDQTLATPNHRYKSWEHCFTAFQNEKNRTDTLALHLGFYLASWGMYRGSAGLLQKDYKVHTDAVKMITDDRFKGLHCYKTDLTADDIDLILQLRGELAECYGKIKYVKEGETKQKQISPTDTLLTKVMLGTLGCIPAYDRYFLDGLKHSEIVGATVNRKSLTNLFAFINEGNNKALIEEAQHTISSANMRYPIMKLLDMYFWVVGFTEELEKEKVLKEAKKLTR